METYHVLCLPGLRNRREGAGGESRATALIRLPEKETPVREAQTRTLKREGGRERERVGRVGWMGEGRRWREGGREGKKETDSLSYPGRIIIEFFL